MLPHSAAAARPAAAAQAQAGLARLTEHVDTLIVIPNDRLLSACDPNLPIGKAFQVADDVLRQGVRGITDIITARAASCRGAGPRDRAASGLRAAVTTTHARKAMLCFGDLEGLSADFAPPCRCRAL